MHRRRRSRLGGLLEVSSFLSSRHSTHSLMYVFSLQRDAKLDRFKKKQFAIFDGMMTLCTNMDPVTGDHKFRARQGRVIQSVVLPVLPATKYQASGSCAHRPARSRYPRDNARHSGRGSSRSVSPRRRGRSRSVDRRHKGEYEHVRGLSQFNDDLLTSDPVGRPALFRRHGRHGRWP